MNIYYDAKMQKMIEKSGVGRALYHQQKAARDNHITIVDTLQQADVVHINTVFPPSVLTACKARKANIPIVYHAHSTREDFRNSYIGSNLLSSLFQKWICFCYSLGDVIVTPTVYAKQLLLAYGIERQIEVVSNGIDLEYYNRKQVEKGSFRKKYGYAEEEKIIMGAGLLLERKGILDFVRLAEEMPEYQFIWFGETNLYTVPRVIRQAVRKKLPNLHFPGYVNREALREAYADCDLFFFPSHEETEGIVVLEALAMKIPILLRDIPVYADWLEADRQVYKADSLEGFAEQIKRILEGKTANLTEAGYQVAKQRSIAQTGKQLYRIYQEMMIETKQKKMMEEKKYVETIF